MTKARLQGLPMHALLELSHKENLDVDPDMTREELIESLFEAFEEDRRERESLNNLIIKIEESKFALSQDDFTDLTPETNGTNIPEKYDSTYVKVLLRDPTWAFAYWEVRTADQEALGSEWGFVGYALRVYELDLPTDPLKNYFQIPVQQATGSRYFNLPENGKYYQVELHALFEKESRFLGRSSSFYAPVDHPPYSYLAGEAGVRQRKLLELSGLLICEPKRDQAPEEQAEAQAAIPQRIGDLNESMFLED